MPGRSKEEGEEVKQKWPSKKKLIVWTVLSNRKRRRRFPVFVLGGECVRVCECVCVVSSAFFIIVGGCVYEGESTIFGVCTHTHRSNPLTHSRKDWYGFSKQQHHQRERNHRHREQSRGSSSIFLAIGRPHWSIIPQDTHLHTCVSPGVSTSLMYWTTVISSSSRAGQSRHRAECVSAGLVRVSECAFYRKQR